MGQVHPQLLPKLFCWSHQLRWQGQAALSVIVCCQSKKDRQEHKQKLLHGDQFWLMQLKLLGVQQFNEYVV